MIISIILNFVSYCIFHVFCSFSQELIKTLIIYLVCPNKILVKLCLVVCLAILLISIIKDALSYFFQIAWKRLFCLATKTKSFNE